MLSRSPRGVLVCVLAILGLSASCGGLPGKELARVLELEDTRVSEEAAWRGLVSHSDALVRESAARAIGRTREPALAPLLRERLALETRSEVREEIVFALGQLPQDESARPLEKLLEEGEGHERVLAAEALGKIRDQFAMPLLVEALGAGDPDLRAAALLSIARLRGRRARVDEPLPKSIEQRLRAAIVARVDDDDESVRWKAAYALSELQLPGGEAGLESALASGDPRQELFALRGLARLEDRELGDAAPRAIGLLASPSPHVAAAAAALLGGAPTEVALDALVPAATRDERDSDWHLRAAAIAALPALASEGDDRPVSLVSSALEDPSPSVRGAALVAAVSLFSPERALEVLRGAGLGADPWVRAAAARAAGQLGGEGARTLLVEMIRARDVHGSPAALRALGADPLGRETARVEALGLLVSDDLALLGSALGTLRDVGAAEDVPAIGDAFRRAAGEALAEVRVEALRTLAALDARGAASLFALALKDPSSAVRREAREGLAAAGGEVSGPEPVEGRASDVRLEIGADVFSREPNPRVALEGSKGRVVIELLREDAPRHVKSFLERARAGLYDGNVLHRVITGFVAQGLDPRGDGWGTGDVFVRDEINRVPFLRGAVGMPNAGPDTAGCQIFINHVPTPHLDGGYTVFGRVVEGMEVVDALDLGDVVERVRIED